jgi:hypothetical protein
MTTLVEVAKVMLLAGAFPLAILIVQTSAKCIRKIWSSRG